MTTCISAFGNAPRAGRRADRGLFRNAARREPHRRRTDQTRARRCADLQISQSIRWAASSPLGSVGRLEGHGPRLRRASAGRRRSSRARREESGARRRRATERREAIGRTVDFERRIAATAARPSFIIVPSTMNAIDASRTRSPGSRNGVEGDRSDVVRTSSFISAQTSGRSRSANATPEVRPSNVVCPSDPWPARVPVQRVPGIRPRSA